jgi:TonB family protein
MTHGKKVCKILKEIRQEIADKNEIEYVTSECHYHGECKGTCPKCEAELKYLENELQKRKQLGKVATIAGISLGIAGAFTACNTQPKQDLPSDEQAVSVNLSDLDITPIDNPPPFLRSTTMGFSPPDNWMKNDSLNISVGAYIEALEGDVDFTRNNYGYKENDIHKFVDKMPEFPNGMEALYNFIQRNTRYPQEAQEKEIEGTVVVTFVVEKDGSLSDFKVITSAHPILDAEAIRVVKTMPHWIPGQHLGKNVRVQYNLPVTFSLKDVE